MHSLKVCNYQKELLHAIFGRLSHFYGLQITWYLVDIVTVDNLEEETEMQNQPWTDVCMVISPLPVSSLIHPIVN